MSTTKAYYNKQEIEEIVRWALDEAKNAEDFANIFDQAVEEDYGYDPDIELAWEIDEEFSERTIQKYSRSLINAYVAFMDVEASLWQSLVNTVHAALESARSSMTEII